MSEMGVHIFWQNNVPLSDMKKKKAQLMSVSYFWLPFFLLKARFIVEKVCLQGPSWVSDNVPPGREAGRTELNTALTSSFH